MSGFAVQVSEKRMFLYEKGAMRAFFDADVGFTNEDGEFVGVFTIRDNSLLALKDGSGYFAKPFERLRERNGQPVLKDDNTPWRDPIVAKFFAQATGREAKVTPTKASYQFFDLITAAAVATYKQKSAGAGTAKPVATPIPATVGASVGESEPGTPFDDAGFDNDNYPFD